MSDTLQTILVWGVIFLLGAAFVWVWPKSPAEIPRSGIRLTRAAAWHTGELLAKHGGHLLRLAVIPAEGGGYLHDARTETARHPGDKLIESEGIKIVVDPSSYELLDGLVLDWREAADGSAGYWFDNPNAERRA